MVIKINIKFIIFFLILTLFYNINLFSQADAIKKDKDKIKDEKTKDEKIKEEKIKEEKIKEEKLSIIKENIEKKEIVSEKVHSEKVNLENIDNKTKINDPKETEKYKQFNSLTSNLENLQIVTDNIIRDIKQSTPENILSIKDQYNYTKNMIEKIENDDIIFMNNLDQEQKDLIKKQNEIIQNSKNNLSKILVNFDKELDRKNRNIENLFEKTKELEKEIRTIYRQYRAIEWILSEK